MLSSLAGGDEKPRTGRLDDLEKRAGGRHLAEAR
jgi:hypothetical protein